MRDRSKSASTAASLVLAPVPRRIRSHRGVFVGSPAASLRIEHEAQPRNHEAYRLSIRLDEIVVRAGTPIGAAHAVRTLIQIARQSPRGIPCLDIDDWPAIANRGVLLDISRDKVPTVGTLFEIIDWLASLKFNQIQLYMEHTFAYREHRDVWRQASPLTPDEIRQLDAYCRERFIELVPCQNTLGHMERWLKLPRFEPLAEATGPWRSPFGDIRTTKSTLNPTDPRSLALVRSLLDELLRCFESRHLNVNCDEPFELGQGRSATVCKRLGVEQVFSDYLNQLHRHAKRRGYRIMCWADMLSHRPGALRDVPRDVVLLEWGYEADHPFTRNCRAYARSGFEFYVCPGTSSWCSFAGRMTNALENLRRAARAAVRCRASGYVITDWGDFGHRQYWPASKAPIVFGATAAWDGRGLPAGKLSRAASLHGFDDSRGNAAEPWLALGDVYRLTGVELRNKTVLFRVMQSSLDDRSAIAGLTDGAIRRVEREINAVERRARSIEARTREQRLVAAELAATIRVLRHACARATAMIDIAAGRDVRSAMAHLRLDANEIVRMHRRLWLARNRPGGLGDSVAHYARLVEEYGRWGKATKKQEMFSGRRRRRA